MRSLEQFLLFVNLLAIQLLQFFELAVIFNLIALLLIVNFVNHVLDFIFEASVCAHQFLDFIITVFDLLFEFAYQRLPLFFVLRDFIDLALMSLLRLNLIDAELCYFLLL